MVQVRWGFELTTLVTGHQDSSLFSVNRFFKLFETCLKSDFLFLDPELELWRAMVGSDPPVNPEEDKPVDPISMLKP